MAGAWNAVFSRRTKSLPADQLATAGPGSLPERHASNESSGSVWVGERVASFAAGGAWGGPNPSPGYHMPSETSAPTSREGSIAGDRSGGGGSHAARATPAASSDISSGTAVSSSPVLAPSGLGSADAADAADHMPMSDHDDRHYGGGGGGAQHQQMDHHHQQQQQHGYGGAATVAGGAGDPNAAAGRPEPLANHPRYQKIRDLNWGTSGFVQLALDLQTGAHVAIKFINRGRQHVDVNMKEISRELLNQRMCALHPNIVQLREVFLTSEYLAVAMEYADGGDLSEYIDQQYNKGVDYMSEDDARWIFQQLIIAVDYCHRLGIANRDIKLDNMLLHGPWPRPLLKLCDFGFSKNEVVQSVSKSTCGTPEYMAPEVLFEMKYNGQDADVWSCGVSLYVLLTGVFPFSRPTDEVDAEGVGGPTRVMRHMFRRIIAGDYFPVPELSAEAQHLIHHMFRPNPAERCTTEDIMAHPWFTKNLPPELAKLNDRLMAAKAQEHIECRRSIGELDRLAPGPQGQLAFHNPFSASNNRRR